MTKSLSHTIPEVLVVDGDDMDRLSLTTLLEEEGYVCQQAGNCLAALRLLKAGYMYKVPPIKVVITDLYMSGLYALDFLGQIKKIDQSHTIRVIGLSREVSDTLWLAAKHAGAYAMFTKPCNFDDLRREIQSIIYAGEVTMEGRS